MPSNDNHSEQTVPTPDTTRIPGDRPASRAQYARQQAARRAADDKLPRS